MRPGGALVAIASLALAVPAVRADEVDAGVGYLDVIAAPRATIAIDGVVIGSGSQLLDVPVSPGRHRVSARAESPTRVDETVVDFAAGRTTHVHLHPREPLTGERACREGGEEACFAAFSRAIAADRATGERLGAIYLRRFPRGRYERLVKAALASRDRPPYVLAAIGLALVAALGFVIARRALRR